VGLGIDVPSPRANRAAVEAGQATHSWRCMLDEIKLGKWGETKSERMKELSTMDGGER